MALTCSVSLNALAYSVGATPPPMATITVYNPNASAVVVTAIQLQGTQFGSNNQTLTMAPSVPPIGPGATTSVPAASSITIGPLPIVLGSAAYVAGANPVVAQPSAAATPINAQGSQPAQYIANIGALVYGSDGSVNAATPAGMTVSHGFPPMLGSQGGFLNFASPQNSCGIIPGWP